MGCIVESVVEFQFVECQFVDCCLLNVLFVVC